eukprot:15470280-Alexandrium_andersonii.AAC.1
MFPAGHREPPWRNARPASAQRRTCFPLGVGDRLRHNAASPPWARAASGATPAPPLGRVCSWRDATFTPLARHTRGTSPLPPLGRALPGRSDHQHPSGLRPFRTLRDGPRR